MPNEDLSQMTDEELLKHHQLMKKTKTYDAFIMGMLIGIAVFSAARNGLGLLTFLPLVYPPIAARNMARRKVVGALLKERGLEPIR